MVLYRPVAKSFEYIGSATQKLFQYAALGLPVIVPDRPSFTEFFGGEGWVHYVDVENPESIAAAIERILTDRQTYTTLSHEARAAFEKRYNYERVFNPVLEHLLEITARGAAA
jgi:glycosyltransferase involved in cell wall biosynthesis